MWPSWVQPADLCRGFYDSRNKIADALEVSIDQIVCGDRIIMEQSISDRELLSMFKKVQLLSERQKETVVDFLSSYIIKNDLKQKMA